MRKLLYVFLFIGVIALGFGIFNNLAKIGSVNQAALHASGTTPPDNSPSVLGFNSPQKEIQNPVTFSIPSLNIVDAAIESVGLDKEGKMDIPKKDEDVGWYNLGAKPGERGNAVIAGHLDTKTGAPAVFYNIKKLKPGDEISTKDKEGNEYKYAVTEVKTYELTEFPLVEVFGAGSKPMLNLITCEGTYDKSSKLYSQRLVVYSELKT